MQFDKNAFSRRSHFFTHSEKGMENKKLKKNLFLDKCVCKIKPL